MYSGWKKKQKKIKTGRTISDEEQTQNKLAEYLYNCKWRGNSHISLQPATSGNGD